jgi:UMF1 family MFS transporter
VRLKCKGSDARWRRFAGGLDGQRPPDVHRPRSSWYVTFIQQTSILNTLPQGTTCLALPSTTQSARLLLLSLLEPLRPLAPRPHDTELDQVPRQQEHFLPRPQPPSRFVSNSKASFVSPSPSFEADDERSLLLASDMEPDDGDDFGDDPAPQYPGEDTRPTSRKELWGWYSYAWASEVFVICGVGELHFKAYAPGRSSCAVGSFIPITLEELARERGVLLSDHKTPCSDALKASPTQLADPLLRVLIRETQKPEKATCVVRILGNEVNTASFAMYTFSISVLLQALVILSMSGAADHGAYRKRLILSFAVVGSIATMLFYPVTPSVFVLGSLFAIISNTCFGASSVLLNSFLPVLVRRYPDVQQAHASNVARDLDEDAAGARNLVDSTAALLPDSQQPTSHVTPPPPKSSPELQVSTRISSIGIGVGYLAAVIVQILCIGILVGMGPSRKVLALRVVLFFIGSWWLLFTVPAAIWLRPRPGPPFAPSQTTSVLVYLTHSWKLLGRTVMQARRLRDISIYLVAWFLLSDALATVSSTAILFAKTELSMPAPALAFISVIATLFGVLGAFAWTAVSRYFRLTPMQTLAACIALFELIPLYGLLGFIPAVQRFGAFGMQAEWEMYVVGAVYGLVLGGVGAYSRALFGELVPPGSEAAFYALYAITDKGSSVFGPAIVGAITDRYGGIRPAFVFLAVLIGLPLPLMTMVDVTRGRAEGRKLASSEGGLGSEAYSAEYTRVAVADHDED